MGIYAVALTSASLQSARYFGFFPKAISCCARQKSETTGPYESAGVRTFFASRSFISEALPSCRSAPELVRVTLHRASTPRACPRSTRARKLSLTRVVRYVTHVCLPCAHIARASRASRGAASVRCYPELPSRERTPKATTRETSPRRARAGVARERLEPPRFRGLAHRVCSFALCQSYPGGT